MTQEAIKRIIRVAGIIALDARQPENQTRAKEIVLLAEMALPGYPKCLD